MSSMVLCLNSEFDGSVGFIGRYGCIVDGERLAGKSDLVLV